MSKSTLPRSRENRRLILTLMKRWRGHNRYGRLMGRGLSESDLIEKVAGETGASKAYIRLALRQED
ncbi:MAG: hypothetical protein WC728_13515 [Elusimicrobiota bacterium]